jgi:hypothetical protein
VKESTMTNKIDTSPARLRELADEALCNTAFVPKSLLLAIAAEKEAPIDMVLHCPKCGKQHIDAPEEHWNRRYLYDWENPPHRSHLCHGCGYIWRPADVPTNGVYALATKGKNDHPNYLAPQPSETAKNISADDAFAARYLEDPKDPLREHEFGLYRAGWQDAQCWLRPSEPAHAEVPLPEPDATLHHDCGDYSATSSRSEEFRSSRTLITDVFTEATLLAHREAYAQAKVAAERERVIGCLNGIDQCVLDDAGGWWTTNQGAEFGAGVLAAVLDTKKGAT